MLNTGECVWWWIDEYVCVDSSEVRADLNISTVQHNSLFAASQYITDSNTKLWRCCFTWRLYSIVRHAVGGHYINQWQYKKNIALAVLFILEILQNSSCGVTMVTHHPYTALQVKQCNTLPNKHDWVFNSLRWFTLYSIKQGWLVWPPGPLHRRSRESV